MVVIKAVLQYFRLVWILLLHSLFTALLLVKVLADKDWSWFLVFVPLLVFDALSFVYWVIYLISYVWKRLNEYDDNEWSSTCFPRQSISLIVLLFYALGLPLKTAAEILMCFSLMNSLPFYVPGVLLCILFLEIGCALMYYNLKPTFALIQRHC